MTMQNYLIIESTLVTNIVFWDGNTSTWQPPQDSIALVQITTPALIWENNPDYTDWILVEKIGYGDIGFVWNGTVLTTNEPKPSTPPVPPTMEQIPTTGTTSA